jgi:hypothetical protein
MYPCQQLFTHESSQSRRSGCLILYISLTRERCTPLHTHRRCATTIRLFLDKDADGSRQKALLSCPLGWDETWKGVENIPLIVIGVMRATPAEAEVFAALIIKCVIEFTHLTRA